MPTSFTNWPAAGKTSRAADSHLACPVRLGAQGRARRDAWLVRRGRGLLECSDALPPLSVPIEHVALDHTGRGLLVRRDEVRAVAARRVRPTRNDSPKARPCFML